MGYTISEKLKQKIKLIPKLNVSLSSIKNISTVRSTYGIENDENIIAYRIIPRPFAKLETGGLIFTDKAVYKKLPSSSLKNDYKTASVNYEEIVEYIPMFNYYNSSQPELVGKFSNKNTIDFWLTPLSDSTSNRAIVTAFWDILFEIIQTNDTYLKKYNNTIQSVIDTLSNQINNSTIPSSSDMRLLTYLLDKKLYTEEQTKDVAYIYFYKSFLVEEYESGFTFLENNTNLLNSEDFLIRIDPIIKSTIEKSKTFDRSRACNLRKLICKYVNRYILELFDDIANYHYSSPYEYNSFDTFVHSFDSTNYEQDVQGMLNKSIAIELLMRGACWEDYSESETTEFLYYVLKFNNFYKEAGNELIEHYGQESKFTKAENALTKVKDITNDLEFVAELEQKLNNYKIEYASNQYTLGTEALENGDRDKALSYINEAIKYDIANQQYMLSYLQLKLDMRQYTEVRSKICDLMENNYCFSEENTEKLSVIKIACIEGITTDIKDVFYSIYNNKTEDICNIKDDSHIYQLTDQFGLNFYHYAIMFRKSDVVSKINIKKSNYISSYSNLNLMYFACQENEVHETFIELLKQYDDTAKKLRKSYNLKSAGKIASDIGVGMLNLMCESIVGSASVASGQYESMSHSSQYESHSDELMQKSKQMKEFSNSLDAERANLLGRYSSPSGGELKEEYINNLINLADEKINLYSSWLERDVKKMTSSQNYSLY